MAFTADLTDVESRNLKLAVSHLIDEGNLEEASALLDASMELSKTETGGIRTFLLQVLFADACGQLTASSKSRLH